MSYLPIVAISMGDPYGSGVEISVKTFAKKELYEKCHPLLVGDLVCLEYVIKLLDSDLKINCVNDVKDCLFTYGIIDVINLDLIKKEDYDFALGECFKIGPSVVGGHAAFKYVEKIIQLALDNKVDATVTNALSKEAINMAGHHYSGHTEIYADYTKTNKYTMMLAHQDLRVVHVSTHVSLMEACQRVKKDRVFEVIRIANQGCKDIGIENPRIAVAGLNPHCGENGMFGKEEIEEIQPAIDLALQEGINITDKKPMPADTIFCKAKGGFYDVVVAMYHDQGHIPLKLEGFVYNKQEKHWDAVAGVNITLGLPIIRTSVDHGTAYDIAGSGVANEISLENAIDYAVKMALARR